MVARCPAPRRAVHRGQPKVAARRPLICSPGSSRPAGEGYLATFEGMDLAERLTLLERMAEAKGIDISTHAAAIQRRLESVEQRLYLDRAKALAEPPS